MRKEDRTKTRRREGKETSWFQMMERLHGREQERKEAGKTRAHEAPRKRILCNILGYSVTYSPGHPIRVEVERHSQR